MDRLKDSFDLSPTEFKLYAYIIKICQEKRSPWQTYSDKTIDEIQEDIGMSRATVIKCKKSLEEKGKIRYHRSSVFSCGQGYEVI